MTLLLILAVVAALAVLMYRIHKGKQSPRTSYHVTTPTLFVSVPIDVPREDGHRMAHDLDAAHSAVWQKFSFWMSFSGEQVGQALAMM